MRYLIADLPVTLEELRAAPGPVRVPGARSCAPGTLLQRGLDTPSGKFELDSLAVAACGGAGLDTLPVYRPPLNGVSPEQYPFRLCAGPRIPNALHSRLHAVPWNRSLRPDPMADLNPADAAGLGVGQGEEIELFTPFGCICVRANLTAAVDRGTVYLFHGYPEADVNTLMDPDHLDPYSGFPAYRSQRLGVRKKV